MVQHKRYSAFKIPTMRTKAILVFLILFTFGIIPSLNSQTATISVDNLNIFYKGCDNPISVVVENCSCKDIVIKASAGKISGEGCHYIIGMFDTVSVIDTIQVGIMKNGVVNWINTFYYRLKKVPDPIPYIDNLKGGIIDKALLCNAGGITPRWDSETSFSITSFSVEIFRKDLVIFNEHISGGRFNKNLIEFIEENCSSNDEVMFYNIIAMGKDGLHRKLIDMNFKIK